MAVGFQAHLHYRNYHSGLQSDTLSQNMKQRKLWLLMSRKALGIKGPKLFV